MEIMHDKLTLFNSVELYKGPIITLFQMSLIIRFVGNLTFFGK